LQHVYTSATRSDAAAHRAVSIAARFEAQRFQRSSRELRSVRIVVSIDLILFQRLDRVSRLFRTRLDRVSQLVCQCCASSVIHRFDRASHTEVTCRRRVVILALTE